MTSELFRRSGMPGRARRLAVGAVAVAALWHALAAGGYAQRFAYVRIDASSYEEFTNTIEFVERRGAILRHRIYPYAAIGQLEAGSELYIAALPGVRKVFLGRMKGQDIARLGPPERYIARAYNKVFYGPWSASQQPARPPATRERIDPAPLLISGPRMERLKAYAAAVGISEPFPPPVSEFMLGHVAIGVILPESDGVGTHDWAESEEEAVTEEIISAMDWWASYGPEPGLRFTYEFNYRVPVKVEPMDRGGWVIEEMWAGQSLSALGYEAPDHIVQAYAYVEEMRRRYDADWGFLTFVLHGKKGQSFGSFLAYAYLGGPINVNVSSNGSLGTENLDRVIAHEVGHNFYALDEYQAAEEDCSDRSGYLNVENANKDLGGPECKLDVSCVMRGAGQEEMLAELTPCVYTKGQVGWWDSDGDGIPDVLDTAPIAELDGSGLDTLYSSRGDFTGLARAVPLENANPISRAAVRDVTIESVTAEYRLDGGPWIPCSPADGEFDSPSEAFSFSVSGLGQWTAHTVEVRAVTAHGNVSRSWDRALLRLVVVPPVEGPTLKIRGPNPTAPPVTVAFAPFSSSAPEGRSVPVEVAVFDVKGRKLATLARGQFQTGKYHSAVWSGTDAEGRAAAPGVYLVAITCGGRSRAEKLVLVR